VLGAWQVSLGSGLFIVSLYSVVICLVAAGLYAAVNRLEPNRWNNQQAVLMEIQRLYTLRSDPPIVGARADRGDRVFTNFNFQGKDVQRAFGATEFNVRLEWL
jgi:hypothetical protein